MKSPAFFSASSLPKTLVAPLSKLLFWTRRYRAQKKYMAQAMSSGAYACTIAYNQFGVYCVPNSALNRPASKKVLQGQVYEPNTIAFMQNNHQQKDIVHAGTFFGDFLPALSKCCTGAQKIWAFEPNPESHTCAQITIKLNSLTNINLTHAGLGEIKSSGAFQTHNEDGTPLGGGSHFAIENETSLSITIMTIDAQIPKDREVGIIQLDVEGFEVQALKGAINTIERCHPIIILEQFPDTDIQSDPWFQTNILERGYTHKETIHGNLVFRHHA